MKPLPAANLQHITERAEYYLQSLDGAHVLVTGATGFVGSWIAEALVYARQKLQLDFDVSVLTRNESAPIVQGVRVLRGDIQSFTMDPTSHGKPTHVIHCASAASQQENDASTDDVMNMIMNGSRQCALVARELGASRFVHLSSGSVYQPRDAYYAEHMELRDARMNGTPAERIGWAKAVAEYEVLGIMPQAVVARAFAMIGPRQKPQFAASQFMAAALAGQPVVVTGDGTAVRSYLYAADMAAWILTLLVVGQPGEAYNVGSPEPVTIETLAHATAALGGPGSPVEVLGGASGGLPFLPSVSKAARLNLEAWTPLGEALHHTWAWSRE